MSYDHIFPLREHSLPLVVLAIGVCFLVSVTAIKICNHARGVGSRERTAWLFCAGIAAGCGVWVTHLIAIVAYQGSVPVTPEIGSSQISLAFAFVTATSGLAVNVVGKGRRSGLIGGAIVGFGVAIMHYSDVLAPKMPAHILWDPTLVAISIAITVILCISALTVAKLHDKWQTTLTAALLLTIAITSLHFSPMRGITFVHDPAMAIDSWSISPPVLAMAMANIIAAFLTLSLVAVFADRRLRQKERDTETAVNNMSHGMVMFNAHGRLVLWNQRFIELYGLSPAVIREGISHFEIVKHRKDSGSFAGDPDFYCQATIARAGEGKPWSRTVELPDGRTIEIVQRPIAGGGWLSTHEDITERVKTQSQIEYLAHHDALTGLANRTAFNKYLFDAIENAELHGNTVAIFCIDLDRFKEVNDLFGHFVGDGLLQKVATRFIDDLGANAFIARPGGDEFVVVVTDAQQPSALEEFAWRLQVAVAGEMDVDGCLVRTGLSIGVAVYPSDGVDSEQLLANADAALYRAKRDGRGRVRFFNADIDKQIRERRFLQNELGQAIENDQMELCYQPLARMSGEIEGFEALARWQNPGGRSIGPDVFIPLAEDNGLIIQLGEWVLRKACHEAASWNLPLRISVNLSPVQFKHGDLPGLIHTILLETGLPAGRLELEITEGVLIDDLARAISILRRLKALGVRIAMDDFGTGYCSLAYLQSFPFDIIKIDRSFVSQLNKDPKVSAIVRAIIQLAHSLSLPVLAEGVETEEQREFLEREGCDEIQGFLVGRPQFIEYYRNAIGKPYRLDRGHILQAARQTERMTALVQHAKSA